MFITYLHPLRVEKKRIEEPFEWTLILRSQAALDGKELMSVLSISCESSGETFKSSVVTAHALAES